jgi:hypothetical protein
VNVAVGRGVRVGDGVHVGRGVLVGVRVQTTGVRVKVGVADNAAMNACIRAVCAACVAIAARSMVDVGEGTVAVG